MNFREHLEKYAEELKKKINQEEGSEHGEKEQPKQEPKEKTVSRERVVKIVRDSGGDFVIGEEIIETRMTPEGVVENRTQTGVLLDCGHATDTVESAGRCQFCNRTFCPSCKRICTVCAETMCSFCARTAIVDGKRQFVCRKHYGTETSKRVLKGFFSFIWNQFGPQD